MITKGFVRVFIGFSWGLLGLDIHTYIYIHICIWGAVQSVIVFHSVPISSVSNSSTRYPKALFKLQRSLC